VSQSHALGRPPCAARRTSGREPPRIDVSRHFTDKFTVVNPRGRRADRAAASGVGSRLGGATSWFDVRPSRGRAFGLIAAAAAAAAAAYAVHYVDGNPIIGLRIQKLHYVRTFRSFAVGHSVLGEVA
jgi:hypothetical protein